MTSFSDSSRDVALATYFETKLADLPSFGTLAFQNGLEYQNVDGHLSSAMNWPTSCRNVVNFGPVTMGIMWLICVGLPV